jgi:hypothetical protein
VSRALALAPVHLLMRIQPVIFGEAPVHEGGHRARRLPPPFPREAPLRGHVRARVRRRALSACSGPGPGRLARLASPHAQPARRIVGRAAAHALRASHPGIRMHRRRMTRRATMSSRGRLNARALRRLGSLPTPAGSSCSCSCDMHVRMRMSSAAARVVVIDPHRPFIDPSSTLHISTLIDVGYGSLTAARTSPRLSPRLSTLPGLRRTLARTSAALRSTFLHRLLIISIRSPSIHRPIHPSIRLCIDRFPASPRSCAAIFSHLPRRDVSVRVAVRRAHLYL